MTYERKTLMRLEATRQDACSPSCGSPLYNRTYSHQGLKSPLATPSLQHRVEARGSPTSHHYMPPPPITSKAGRVNTVDLDLVTQGSSPVPNLNNAIPCSPSPLAEARYPCLGEPWRPASAVGTRPYGELDPITSCSSPQRAASAVIAPPRTKATYHDGCGIIVEERDSLTREVISRYRCGSLLGTGGFAQVYEFKDLKTNVQYAGKIIDKRNLTRRGSESKLLMEIDIHRRVKHPNIVQFVKAFQDESYHYIILEQCSKKSLMDLSKERGVFATEEIQYIMIQIVSAVEYMHRNLIIHRDLKLGNIMIDAYGNMKIGDFGFASELASASEKKNTTCGTPNYIAPEVLACDKTGLGYGLEADIWSLGVILYALAFGTPPFETKDITATYNRIRRVYYIFPRGIAVPESCKELIRWMLQKQPQHRPTPAEILRHSFLCIPQPPRTAPRSLVPPQAPRSTSPNARGSPLWASPIAINSPFIDCDRFPVDYQKTALRKEENKKGTEHELQMTLHEFLKENDCISETTSEVRHLRSCGKPVLPKPPLPSIVLKSSVFCNKYGYGFLSYQCGKQYPVVFLNDKTKLIYDIDSDTVFYYGRARMQAVTPGSGNRSPLLSEELAAKGFRDELVVFPAASTRLAHRNEGEDATSLFEASAAKKLAITKFFLPFLERGTRDKRMVAMTCALREWCSSWEKDLFLACGSGDEQVDIVYVKDAVLENLYELTGEHRDTDVQLLVARMSDYSFQVSVRCNGAPQASFRPKYNVLEASENSLPWCLDVLVYAGFRAVMAMETAQSSLAFSFWDIRRDAKTVKDGRVYFAARSTTQLKSMMLPTALLRTIAILLRKVRCCNDIVDCFC
ncbi:serine/threonine protein kinase, putative [Trypanosoma cruzi]|uniref:Serine/threonine protein kinase, putative n=1 Tax=Trypanosoma cruzi (strain CL Brener) TaxID=353153 RepID=Q4DX65_TRYCC|nr:serine/threonine protein kinase, putative [Trypanosoma cruzi]EAN97147.1 serine/threonine protein kinase, putative [Trypanosoma cruzi]|eukprot:XP_818998.1 serine/threonine protein kinase [Trypanosoma cruzi strain CL Brener]